MTNFTISESDWTKEFYTTYTQIKKDIKNGMKIKDIKKKHGLSEGQWGSYRRELIYDGIIIPVQQKRQTAKYYHYSKGKYHVSKNIDGKRKHIGTFKTESQAKWCVELMKECNWDLTQLDIVRNKVRGRE